MAKQGLLSTGLECDAPVLRAGAQGMANVDVDDSGMVLTVNFKRPAAQAQLLNPRSYSLTGGQRLFPRVIAAAPAGEASVRLTLDEPGDFSIYTLSVAGPEIDPFFSSQKVRFRLSCDDHFDWQPTPARVLSEPDIPVTIDYLAKDYASFRQALLEFIPTRLPEWTERNEADAGIMLLELFAWTADQLSYMQDRVAAEAFLATAIERRSVAGHLAMTGYRLDEGAAAHTWLQFQVRERHTLNPNSGVKVSNHTAGDTEPVIVFEVLNEARLDPRHNEMILYTWGNMNCSLPRTSMHAALAGKFEALAAGDHLLFEDDLGNSDVVQLTAAPEILPAGEEPVDLTIVHWGEGTPLGHDFCIVRTRVRGNLVQATHGETVPEETLRDPAVEQKGAMMRPASRLRLSLKRAPLAYLDPAVPDVSPGGSTLVVKVDGEIWEERTSLLESRGDAKVFRVDVDDAGVAAVVFGDGTFGMRPAETARITATYRVGGGKAGNTGPRTLTQLQLEEPAPWFISVTNPVAATGGRDRETGDHARRTAPGAARNPQPAVSAADYEAAALSFTSASGQQPVRRANASFRWTGSWLTVRLAVDARTPEGLLTDALTGDLRACLEARRVAGYDLEIVRAAYLDVDLALEFRVLPGFHPATVEQGLRSRLSDQDLPGGAKGFFHPDIFGFGDNLFVSSLFAASMAVAGVADLRIARLAPLDAAQPDGETAINLRRGFLAAGPDQIIRLHNDRNFPEHGTLTLRFMGAQR